MRVHAYQNSIFRPWKIAPLRAMIGKLYGELSQNQNLTALRHSSMLLAGIQ